MYIIIRQDYDEVQILGHTSNKEVADEFVKNYLEQFEINRKDVLNTNEQSYKQNLSKFNLLERYNEWLKEEGVRTIYAKNLIRLSLH